MGCYILVVPVDIDGILIRHEWRAVVFVLVNMFSEVLLLTMDDERL